MELTFGYDDGGRIVPMVEARRDIFLPLLDYRLDSRRSMRIYDVQSREAVG